ncbi:MAG: TetR/AcrR family transcriptional regulator [Pseudomonadota bacterium]
MRLKAEDKAKITLRIRAAAAKTFRQQGYDAVNLDLLMKEAGLTRGAFYAHYKSKAALFADVMHYEHPLLRMLENRNAGDAVGLYEDMLTIFSGYLDADNLDEVFQGCSLAALTGDTTRSGDEVKAGYGAAFTALCEEMGRGQSYRSSEYSSALILAAGAVRAAKAMSDHSQQAQTLKAARDAFITLLPKP